MTTTMMMEPIPMELADFAPDQPFTAETCPVSWTAAQGSSLNVGHPFTGRNPEELTPLEYVSRRYYETLWLPEHVMRLENFIRDLQRTVTSSDPVNANFRTNPIPLVHPVFLERSDIREKYRRDLPRILDAADVQTDVEQKMIHYAWSLEKNPPEDHQLWIARFHRREFQLQILLRLFCLTFPLQNSLPSPTKSKSPSKKHQKHKRQWNYETVEDDLLSLFDGLNALAEGETGDSAENGWLSEFCEDIIGPLFQSQFNHLYARCLQSLCPTKYSSPSSSPIPSPNFQTAQLPYHRQESLAPASRRSKSRSPSIPPTALEEKLQEERDRRSVSVVSLKRERSASVLSLGGDGGVGQVTRATKTISAMWEGRGVEMYKKMKVKEKEKEKPPVVKRAPVPRGTGNVPAPTQAKRAFARSATMPANAAGSLLATASRTTTLVPETPEAPRVRTYADNMDDSPDTLRLGSGDDNDDDDEPDRPPKRRVFVPETPAK